MDVLLSSNTCGVAAWSLTTESLRENPQYSPVYQDHLSGGGRHPDWFEKRKDELGFGAKLPIGASMNKHELGPDIVPDDRDLMTAPDSEVDVLPAPPEATSTDNDPLYVVHYVPEGNQKEFGDPTKPHPESVNVLSKILSDSKRKSAKGTPQFIVIAPMHQKEDDVGDYDDEEDEVDPRKKRKKGRKSRRRDHKSDLTPDHHTEPSQYRHQVEPAPYESTGSQEQHDPPHHHHAPHQHHPNPHQNHPQTHHQPQPHHHQPSPSNYPQRHDNYYHHHHPPPTPAPPPSVSITIMPSFGLLRSILRPRFDLKKKMFFGIQLENGIGFGGFTDAPTTAAPTTRPPYHGGGVVHHGLGSTMSFYKK